MKNIFVVGAGTMGLDIAQLFAAHGFTVTVRDISDGIVSAAKKRLEANVARLAAKGKLTEARAADILGRVSFTTELADAARAELVLEAIVENIAIKSQVFSELNAICPPDCLFASNTSSVSITDMAVKSGRPERFIGMHFFNPPGIMKLVELIRALTTSDGTFETARELCLALEKEPVEVKDSPGFVVNRILTPMMNEAAFLVQEGVASAEDIDKAMRLGANHPMGPLHLADLVGLDVVVYICDVMYNETHDSKFAACYLLRKMVRAGLLGRKSGRGFFDYS